MSFVNNKASEMSKLSNIFLLAVGKSKDLKSMDAKAKLLSDFFSTMNELQTGCFHQTMHCKETFLGTCWHTLETPWHVTTLQDSRNHSARMPASHVGLIWLQHPNFLASTKR